MDLKTLRESRWFRWGRDLLLVGLLFVGVMTYQTWGHVGSGEPAPDFDLAVLDDDVRVSTASLRGKPTVIYFWAPWCGVCEASSHNVDAVHEAVGDDYDVVSIALEYSSLENVREFVERNETTYPVLLGNGDVRGDFKVDAFPTLYVLDSDGDVVSSVVGYTTELGIRSRLWLASFR